MSTATKDKEVKSLHFTVTGAFMTNFARESFVSDKPKSAIDFLMKSVIGITEDQAWPIILGTKKLTDDSTVGLGYEDDDTKTCCGIPLTLENMWNRLAKMYFDETSYIQMLARRIMIFGNSLTPEGAKYRTSKGYCINEDCDCGYTMSLPKDTGIYMNKKKRMQELMHEILCVGEKLNRSIADLPMNNLIVYPDAPGLLRVARDDSNYFTLEELLCADLDDLNNKLPYNHDSAIDVVMDEDHELNLPLTTEAVLTKKAVKSLPFMEPEKDISDLDNLDEYINEQNQKALRLMDMPTLPSVDEYISAQIAIDKELATSIEPVDHKEGFDAGWIAPDGTYYALNGEIANMLHNQIADALLEAGVIPKPDEDDITASNPDVWLENNGWVKQHGNWILFGEYCKPKPAHDVTDEQKKVIHELCGLHHKGVVKAGFKMERMSSIKFQSYDKFALRKLLGL